MQYKEAYALDAFDPTSSTRRIVFDMPGNNKLVVKFFGSNTNIGTVKLWSGALDYQRTVRSWKTNKRVELPARDIKAARELALELIVGSGFAIQALVNRPEGDRY